MTNDQIKTLCVDLAKAESEKAVINILQRAKLWDDQAAWIDYDHNPNNFSTIGNQQSSPDAALVEKIINSVDAVLMRECQRQQVEPSSAEAPSSMQEALKKYFGIYNGKLSSIDAKRRSEIAKNILLVATGSKQSPCYSIIDCGEGQTPRKMPNTFLSLNKTNKFNVQFVQGKFNMGGTGALQFCSPQHNLQLIISRRDPEIAKYEDDSTKNKWGFTIIRREEPKGNMRSSSFRYLAPDGQILMFDAENLPLLPQEYPNPYGKDFHYGTYIKLYEYQLTGLKTIVKFDLYYRLSLLLPNIALPITMYERREGYQADSYYIVMSGLSVRLDEDKSENLEPNFPNSSTIKVMGQEMKVLVYAFKKDKRQKYTRDKGVIFTVNGQARGFLPQTFFERKSVGMSYLADSILVIVDCSGLDRRIQEDLFMNSRDRLRDGIMYDEIVAQLEDLINNHVGLRTLRDQRRKEEVEGKLQDSKPLAKVLEDIIKKSPALSKLLIGGQSIKAPFITSDIECRKEKEFKGKRFPTYFKIARRYSSNNPKVVYINKKFRIQFETDANNDYFNRDDEPGHFNISCAGQIIEDFSLNLWDGIATLTLSFSANDVEIGDILLFQTETIDSRGQPFDNEFYVKVVNQAKNDENSGGVFNKKDHTMPYLALPNIIALRIKDKDWTQYFKNLEDALAVKDAGENNYDFYINLDNKYLQTEIKENSKITPQLLEDKFKSGMVLIGMALIKYFQDHADEVKPYQCEDLSMYKIIFLITKAISPFLLPIMSYSYPETD